MFLISTGFSLIVLFTAIASLEMHIEYINRAVGSTMAVDEAGTSGMQNNSCVLRKTEHIKKNLIYLIAIGTS